MLHINRLYPPTLPCYPSEQRNTIQLLYHSACNLPIYISVPSHPPTSPQMSDWSAPSWSSAEPLSDSADRSVRATLACVWKWKAGRRRSLQIKNDFSLVKHAAVISGPARSECSPNKMASAWRRLLGIADKVERAFIIIYPFSGSYFTTWITPLCSKCEALKSRMGIRW